MNILEQRQIKIIWIIFVYVLLPGMFWQLGFKFQQFVLALLRLPRQRSGSNLLGNRD